MKTVADTIALSELKRMAENSFGDMVKAVVDVKREILAVDADLHADLEALLLQDGSQQEDVWGINLYPGLPAGEWIEFDSLINIRPKRGNRSREVEDEDMRRRILDIVGKRVTP